jgi:hypothetical protein
MFQESHSGARRKKKTTYGLLNQTARQIVTAWVERWRNPTDCDAWASDDEI